MKNSLKHSSRRCWTMAICSTHIVGQKWLRSVARQATFGHNSFEMSASLQRLPSAQVGRHRSSAIKIIFYLIYCILILYNNVFSFCNLLSFFLEGKRYSPFQNCMPKETNFMFLWTVLKLFFFSLPFNFIPTRKLCFKCPMHRIIINCVFQLQICGNLCWYQVSK